MIMSTETSLKATNDVKLGVKCNGVGECNAEIKILFGE